VTSPIESKKKKFTPQNNRSNRATDGHQPGRVEVHDLEAGEHLLPQLRHSPDERVHHVQVALDPRPGALEHRSLARLVEHGATLFRRRSIVRFRRNYVSNDDRLFFRRALVVTIQRRRLNQRALH